MKFTWLLVLLCIAGFAYPVLYGPETYDTYGFSLDNLQQRPYVFFTSIFMHASFEHLISNIFVLIFFGLAVESELGSKRMLMIFFLGALAGDVLSLAVYAPSEIAVGASAGIFALIGVGMLVRPLDLSFYPLVVPIPLALLGIAHFGGLFVGLMFGFRHQAKCVTQSWKRSVKIIMITFLIMILIPLIWLLISAK